MLREYNVHIDIFVISYDYISFERVIQTYTTHPSGWHAMIWQVYWITEA